MSGASGAFGRAVRSPWLCRLSDLWFKAKEAESEVSGNSEDHGVSMHKGAGSMHSASACLANCLLRPKDEVRCSGLKVERATEQAGARPLIAPDAEKSSASG